jgi:putative polymerase
MSSIYSSSDPYYAHAAGQSTLEERAVKTAVFVVIAASAIFNMALAFANAHIVGITPFFPMMAEVLIIGTTLALIIRKYDAFTFFFVTGTVGYLATLFIFRGYLDPKPVRDILIPILFFRLGVLYGTERGLMLVTKFLLIVTFIIGAWELASPNQFGEFFGVLKYFVAKGATGEESMQFIQNGLNVNALRPQGQGREILPFLGPHRVSSIFLEPVTTGNFGALCIALFLGTGRGLRNWPWYLMAVALLVFADARFGVLLAVGGVLLFQLGRLRQPVLLGILPILIIIALAVIGSLGGTTPNTLEGRLIYSGKALYNFNIGDWFGIPSDRKVWHDSGYAYVISQFGLPYCLLIWTMLATLNPVSAVGRFRICYVMAFVCASMAVSASLLSIKIAALMWFACGAALRLGNEDDLEQPSVASMPPRF